jgi:hypothetical protein
MGKQGFSHFTLATSCTTYSSCPSHLQTFSLLLFISIESVQCPSTPSPLSHPATRHGPGFAIRPKQARAPPPHPLASSLRQRTRAMALVLPASKLTAAPNSPLPPTRPRMPRSIQHCLLCARPKLRRGPWSWPETALFELFNDSTLAICRALAELPALVSHLFSKTMDANIRKRWCS